MIVVANCNCDVGSIHTKREHFQSTIVQVPRVAIALLPPFPPTSHDYNELGGDALPNSNQGERTIEEMG